MENSKTPAIEAAGPLVRRAAIATCAVHYSKWTLDEVQNAEKRWAHFLHKSFQGGARQISSWCITPSLYAVTTFKYVEGGRDRDAPEVV